MADSTASRAGTVTDVVLRAGSAERVDVWLDGAKALDLALAIATEAGLRTGLRLTVEDQAELVARDRLLAAREAALRYLSDQARTVAEVRRALGRRGFDASLIDGVIDYVQSQGYVDDAEYARAFVRSRFASRGHGPARVRDDLVRKGVDRGTIEAAIEELADRDDLADAAFRLAESRWRALGSAGDPRRRRQRTLEYLVRRGYTFDDAREAVERATAGEGDEAE
jgi:regulatory protein